MPEGVIIGGWEYVVAAYAIFAGGLLVYSLVLLRWRSVRHSANRRNSAREKPGANTP